MLGTASVDGGDWDWTVSTAFDFPLRFLLDSLPPRGFETVLGGRLGVEKGDEACAALVSGVVGRAELEASARLGCIRICNEVTEFARALA